ncbi:MAG: LapA family protein [Deltaproteobacteria bacterium]|nr:LapA family protein [Deltaproteobacteria bacterium]
MKKLIFAGVMALIFFVMLNFVLVNLDGQTFNYPLVFKFNIPMIMPNGYQTVPLPLWFVLLAVFCFGMIFIALLEALPSFYKTLELRSRNKKIRALERELKVAREMSGVEKGDKGSTLES